MNFIEIVDDTPPLWDKRKTYGELNTCKEIIDYFESVPNKSKGGLPFFNKSRQKVCVTKSFNFGDDNPINSSIYTFVNTRTISITIKIPCFTFSFPRSSIHNIKVFWRNCNINNSCIFVYK